MERSLHYLLLITQNSFYKEIISEAAQIGLSPGQPKILEFLSVYDGCEQKNIAESCEIEPATVSNILSGMEKAGLIEKKKKEGNRRSSFIYLTEKGKRTADEMNGIFLRIEERALRNVSKEEEEAFLSMLYKVYQNMSVKNIHR